MLLSLRHSARPSEAMGDHSFAIADIDPALVVVRLSQKYKKVA